MHSLDGLNQQPVAGPVNPVDPVRVLRSVKRSQFKVSYVTCQVSIAMKGRGFASIKRLSETGQELTLFLKNLSYHQIFRPNRPVTNPHRLHGRV